MDQEPKAKLALMLPGGGARGAYQVGAIRAIHEISGGTDNPFPIIVGNSAGAINATVLASHACDFAHGIERLAYFWGSMRCSHVYRTDWPTVVRYGLHWIGAMLFGRIGVPSPHSLLDTSPLRHLLETECNLPGIQSGIDQGELEALAMSVSGYTSAGSITFFQAPAEYSAWKQRRRIGRPTRITVDHIMASAALPILFPAVRIGNEYFGDGGVRLTAPTSPAIRLQADRIIVLSTRDERQDPEPQAVTPRPTVGDVVGNLMDAVFMDNLQTDLDRIQRVNESVALSGEKRGQARLRHIETLVIRPSIDVREIADEYMNLIPSSVKLLLAGIGAWRPGTRLPSYLLFEAEYCQRLLDLGYQDALDQRRDIEKMFAAEVPGQN